MFYILGISNQFRLVFEDASHYLAFLEGPHNHAKVHIPSQKRFLEKWHSQTWKTYIRFQPKPWDAYLGPHLLFQRNWLEKDQSLFYLKHKHLEMFE